jgi:hypothetical protein
MTAPSVIALTRQALPQLAGTSIAAVAKGAYVLQDATDGKVGLPSPSFDFTLLDGDHDVDDTQYCNHACYNRLI